MVITAGNGNSAGEPFSGWGAVGHTHRGRIGAEVTRPAARRLVQPLTLYRLRREHGWQPGKGYFPGRHCGGNADLVVYGQVP